MSNVASRTYKKEDFAVLGLKFAPSVAFGRHDRQGTGKQHGLASSRTPFFDLRWGDLQCQTLRPEPIKKRILQFWGSSLHLQLRLGVTTGKTATYDPKAFPKRLAPERGSSMAWRAQGHRFSTCVGVIFNVKRCVQNL